jgi:RNase P subunit RPR2
LFFLLHGVAIVRQARRSMCKRCYTPGARNQERANLFFFSSLR